jgi:hypothetical protein
MRSSETLRTQQRQEQIPAERERDDQAEDGFGHYRPLQVIGGDGIEAEQPKDAEPQRQIDEVQHCPFSLRGRPNPATGLSLEPDQAPIERQDLCGQG